MILLGLGMDRRPQSIWIDFVECNGVIGMGFATFNLQAINAIFIANFAFSATDAIHDAAHHP